MSDTIEHMTPILSSGVNVNAVSMRGLAELVQKQISSKYGCSVDESDLTGWVTALCEEMDESLYVEQMADMYVKRMSLGKKEEQGVDDVRLHGLVNIVQREIESQFNQTVDSGHLAKWLTETFDWNWSATSIDDLVNNYVQKLSVESLVGDINEQRAHIEAAKEYERLESQSVKRSERQHSLYPDKGSDFGKALNDVSKRSSRLVEALHCKGYSFDPEEDQEERKLMFHQLVRKPIRSFVQIDFFNYETGAAGFNGDGYDVFGPTHTREFSNSDCLRLLIPEAYTQADVLKALDEFKRIVEGVKPASFGDQVKAEYNEWIKPNSKAQEANDGLKSNFIPF